MTPHPSDDKTRPTGPPSDAESCNGTLSTRRDFVAAGEHSTILGKIKFVGSENVGTPGSVSQWQKGEFEVVWPKASATAPLVAKPNWV